MQLLIRVIGHSASAAGAAEFNARLHVALRTWAGVRASALRVAHPPQLHHADAYRFEHAWWLSPATLDDVRGLMALAPEGWTPPRIEDALLQVTEDEDGSWVRAQASPAWLVAEPTWVELHFQHDAL